MRAERRPRVSRVAGGVAAAILFALFFAYAFSMTAGGMDRTMSTDAAAPATGGQMVMPDGSAMDVGQHPSESPGTAAAPAASTPAEARQMEMGGSINWYVIGGILALVAAGIALAAGLNEHLARRIAMGTLAIEGVCVE